MISAIVPVYNSEKYIQRMIDSLFFQTYQNYEVILVDDGSSDDSGDICERISKKDNRFIVIHQSNIGAGAARNAGLMHVTGEWVAFLDSDDLIPENYFEVLMNRQNETGADLVICNVELCNEENEPLSSYICKEKVTDSFEGLNLLLSRKEFNSGPCGKLIRKDTAVSSQFPDLDVYEDILYMKEILCNAKTIAFTNKTKYIYYQHESSLMANSKLKPSEDIIVATERLASFIKERNRLSDDCLYVTLSHLYQYVITQTSQNNREAKVFIKDSRKVFFDSLGSILKNSAFPWKEKVLFLLFALGVDPDILQKEKG
ncbi:MAG: glycosyltransferase family 2 protein [Erysipelotrichaceae bacterium]|nr:glycosyltransferase family 2 protein [Clostridia bacterium]MBQ6217759.1 glycosyltransferase family 2 protein [Erysipelotrichaceae bacterium]